LAESELSNFLVSVTFDNSITLKAFCGAKFSHLVSSTDQTKKGFTNISIPSNHFLLEFVYFSLPVSFSRMLKPFPSFFRFMVLSSIALVLFVCSLFNDAFSVSQTI
jgi:hypothetical protein